MRAGRALDEAEPRAPAQPARRAGNHGVVPFPDIPSLVGRAEIITRRRAAHRGDVAVLGVPVRARSVIRHIRAGIRDVAGGVGRSHRRHRVALGRIQPVIVRARSGRRVVIRRFIPLVLAGQPDGRAYTLPRGREAQIVGPAFGATCSLAVVKPVGEAGSAPGDKGILSSLALAPQPVTV